MEDRPPPEDIDYAAVPGRRTEARRKRVAVRAADMTALMIYTESGKERRHG